MSEKQLLIVDDSPIIVSRLHSLLEGLPGLGAIHETGSIKEAIHLLAQRTPDILLLDINLPDGNGMDLLRFAKKHYPSITVIMVSNQASPFYRNICRREGAAAFIDKSADFEQVPAIVSSFL